jgi:S1-C subfamily serine protease
MANLLAQLNEEIGAVVARVRQSLVQIHTGQMSQGAGTIWHAQGLILTNAHVVAGSRALEVVLSDGRRAPARLLHANPEYDLAALSIEAEGLPTIELGDSAGLEPGAWVMAVGHPWGVAGAVTSGTLIGRGAQLPDMPAFKREWLAVNLAMRPGHSGGALVDSRGRLLGVNTLISGPEVGYAIPVHVVKQYLKANLV